MQRISSSDMGQCEIFLRLQPAFKSPSDPWRPPAADIPSVDDGKRLIESDPVLHFGERACDMRGVPGEFLEKFRRHRPAFFALPNGEWKMIERYHGFKTVTAHRRDHCAIMV